MIAGCYQIDQPSVVSETIDDEVVILDLRAGLYFSITGLGAAIWNALVAGHAVEAILAAASTAFPEHASEVGPAVSQFVARLVEQKLLLPAASPAVAPADALHLGGAFAAPVLSSYEDMEDLLLLDPIHDVEEAGWPVRKPVDPES